MAGLPQPVGGGGVGDVPRTGAQVVAHPAGQVSLHDIAPRLARARDDYRAWLAECSRIQLQYADDLLRAERLLAHRDLQMVRAGARGKRRYLEVRARKLREAQQLVDRLRRRGPVYPP